MTEAEIVEDNNLEKIPHSYSNTQSSFLVGMCSYELSLYAWLYY